MVHKTQENIYYVYQFVIKNSKKDTDERLNEDVYRARSGTVLSAGTSVPTEFGMHNPLARGFIHQLRSSPNPNPKRFLWKLHHEGMND